MGEPWDASLRIPKGIVSDWTCPAGGCAGFRNFGDRQNCHLCGRHPSQTTKDAQRAASRAAAAGGPVSQRPQRSGGGHAGIGKDEIIADLRKQLQLAKGPAADETPEPSNPTAPADPISSEVKMLEGQLAAVRGSAGPAADIERANLEDRLAKARDRQHAGWPLERRLLRADRQLGDTEAKAAKVDARIADLRGEMVTLQAKLDEELQKAANVETERGARLAEQVALRAEQTAAGGPQGCPPPAQGPAQDMQLLGTLLAQFAAATSMAASSQTAAAVGHLQQVLLAKAAATPNGSQPGKEEGQQAKADATNGTAAPENSTAGVDRRAEVAAEGMDCDSLLQGAGEFSPEQIAKHQRQH